jgi:hypothetical protein
MSNELFVKSDEHIKTYIESNSTLDDKNIIKKLIKKFKYDIEDIEYVYSLYFEDRIIDFNEIMNNSVKRTDKTFKEEVKKRYNECIISNYNKNQCDVAHIKPFSECNNISDKYNPDNGLLLSKDIHIQFDKYIFTIDPETSKVVLNTSIKDINTYSIFQYNHKKIDISSNSKIYLKYHYANFKKLNFN